MSQMGHEPTCAPSCRQLVEQSFRLLQVQRVKALGEAAVDGGDQGAEGLADKHDSRFQRNPSKQILDVVVY